VGYINADNEYSDNRTYFGSGIRLKAGGRGQSRSPLALFHFDEILARDKVSLDIFWLRDDSLGDMDNLPEPDEIAEEIVENLEAGLEGFRRVLASLEAPSGAEPEQ